MVGLKFTKKRLDSVTREMRGIGLDCGQPKVCGNVPVDREEDDVR